jgi:hypothetical protein
MKPDNKLGKLRFDPNQAFEELRKLGRRVMLVPKKRSPSKQSHDTTR